MLELPPLAMKVLGRLPRMASNPYVFYGRSDGRLAGYLGPPCALHGALRRRRLDLARLADAPRAA